jgi:ubiquinone/menaquinone biosynthesis C-methylase UbiE
MRRALDIRPGTHVLDAGCGIGIETMRLAADHPQAHVTGLDRNADLPRAARRRSDGDLENLRWHEADLLDLDLPAAARR